MTAPADSSKQPGLVARALNSLKAIVALVGSALTGVVTFLPEGTYKGYVVTAIAIATGVGTYLAKNQPLIEQLSSEAVDVVVDGYGRHAAKVIEAP